MDTGELLIGGVCGIAAGVAAGVYLGMWSAKRPSWWFWVCAAALLLVGMVVSALGARSATDTVFFVGVGFIGGGLTALKYASRRIPGLGKEA